MGHSARLHLVGRVTYYIGWVALLCGGLVQIKLAQSIFLAMNISKRNLFELAIASFIICIASELRANMPAEATTVVKRPMAA